MFLFKLTGTHMLFLQVLGNHLLQNDLSQCSEHHTLLAATKSA